MIKKNSNFSKKKKHTRFSKKKKHTRFSKKKKHTRFSKKKQVKKKKTKIVVGKIIGRGTFGCVCNPGIQLSNSVNLNNIVSKLVLTDYAGIEIELLLETNKIDPRGIYFSYMDEYSSLSPTIRNKQTLNVRKDIMTCIKSESNINKYTVINLRNTGNSLDKYFDVNPHTIIAKEKTRLKKEFVHQIIHLLHGLNKLHINKICHRDIKPENISYGLFDKDYICRYLDFGLSINFLTDRRPMLQELIENLKALPPIEKEKYHKLLISSNNDLQFLNVINKEPFSIDNNVEASYIVSKIFCGTPNFFPPEYFSFIIHIANKFPDLAKPDGYISKMVYPYTNKPYNEDEMIQLMLIKSMQKFKTVFSEEIISIIPEYVKTLSLLPDLIQGFFNYGESTTAYPFIYYSDYYALGLTLSKMYESLQINDDIVLSFIKELCNYDITIRGTIKLPKLIEKIIHSIKKKFTMSKP